MYDWVPSWLGMKVKCFAESKGPKRLLSPALVKVGLTLTLMRSGSGCLHMQYPCMYLEHILISSVRKGQCFIGSNWLLPFLFPPAMKDLSVTAAFGSSLQLFLSAPLITTTVQSPTVKSAKSETLEVMYNEPFSLTIL